MDQHDGQGEHGHEDEHAQRDPLGPHHTRAEAGHEPLPDELRETLGLGPPGGGAYLYRADQLLVSFEDAQRVKEGLDTSLSIRARSLRSRETDMDDIEGLIPVLEETGLDLLDVSGSSRSVEDLVSGIRLRGEVDSFGNMIEPPVRLYPNHALSVASHVAWCPKGPPGEPQGLPDFIPPEHGSPEGGVVEEAERIPRTVGLLDVGFTDHPFFRGRVDLPADPATLQSQLIDDHGALRQYAGHGTFATGILLTNAPDVKVIARTIDPKIASPTMTWVTDTTLATALRDARDSFFNDDVQIDVLVLPIAGPTHCGSGLPATRGILNSYRALKPDLVIVAAAGNDAEMTPYFPAAYGDVIAVAALARTKDDLPTFDSRADFSNFGGWVDACALGKNLYSTFVNLEDPVTWSGQSPPVHRTYRGTAIWSGTSFAAPAVAAAILNRLQVESPPLATWNLLQGPGVRRITDLGAFVSMGDNSMSRLGHSSPHA